MGDGHVIGLGLDVKLLIRSLGVVALWAGDLCKWATPCICI